MYGSDSLILRTTSLSRLFFLIRIVHTEIDILGIIKLKMLKFIRINK